MRVVIDRGIPFLDGVIEPYAEVAYLSPEDIGPEAVRDADALIIRTRTRVNKELLEGSQVRFVATATIGYDHIDQDYCREAGIYWTSCPGCNAQAVCDYVEEAIATFNSSLFRGRSGESLTIGIVGYGHVGKRVAQMAERKGYRVLLSDPPLGIGLSLEEMAPQCDILTFHTPLTRDGEYPTYHLCNAAILRLCKPGALIINAARGGVIDEQALLPYLIASSPHHLIASSPNRLIASSPISNSHMVAYTTGTMPSGTHLVGEYNAENVSAALCVGECFGIPREQALEAIRQYVPTNNRSQKMQTANNQLIVDAYNANPTSMQAAINAFKGDTYILGAMRELGEYSHLEHQNIVNMLAERKADTVLLVGEEYLQTTSPYPVFENVEQLHKYLEDNPLRDRYILLKGSRSTRMEQLLDVL